ncbi:MAG TPA: hypothetical protein VIJ14_04135 [Rhabdochlamydiaceae bacterium]
MIELNYPNKDETQIIFDVRGTSKDFEIVSALELTELGNVVNITRKANITGRWDNWISRKLSERQESERENHYFDMGKAMMTAKRE